MGLMLFCFLILYYMYYEIFSLLMKEIEQVFFFTRIFSVSEIIHSAFPIEYPKTLPQGVATIFNIGLATSDGLF